jgi:hypothetical protein
LYSRVDVEQRLHYRQPTALPYSGSCLLSDPTDALASVICKPLRCYLWHRGVGMHETAQHCDNTDSKPRYSGTPLMHLGTLGTLTSIETSKCKWLRQKLDGSLWSMKRGCSITTSKRSSCSTMVSHSEGLKEQNRLSWYREH